MATHNWGYMGGFAGKLGPGVGTRHRNKEVIRAMPRKRKDKPNAEQLEQRAKIALIGAFIKRFTDVVSKTFVDEDLAGANVALAYNIRNAISGNYPGFSINYPNVLLAKGDVFMVSGGSAAAGNAGEIVFNWQNNSNEQYAPATDTALVICYCPDFDRAIYEFTSATRSDLTTVLNAASFSGKLVHTWMAFTSKKGASNSVYCGSLTVL